MRRWTERPADSARGVGAACSDDATTPELRAGDADVVHVVGPRTVVRCRDDLDPDASNDARCRPPMSGAPHTSHYPTRARPRRLHSCGFRKRPPSWSRSPSHRTPRIRSRSRRRTNPGCTSRPPVPARDRADSCPRSRRLIPLRCGRRQYSWDMTLGTSRRSRRPTPSTRKATTRRSSRRAVWGPCRASSRKADVINARGGTVAASGGDAGGGGGS